MGPTDLRASVAADAPTVLAVGPDVAITSARTTGVRFFERRPPVHGVLLGRCEIALAGRRVRSEGAMALPAGASHSVVAFGDPYAGVAYLDARRYRFEDVQWRTWFKLQRAIREAALGEANLTEAAHRAGFADSAHLTRTCKQLLGVRPAEMLPRVVHVVGRLP